MTTARFFMFGLVGWLVACGPASEQTPEDAAPAMGQSEASVIVGSVNWVSTSSLSGPQAERARAVGYLQVPGTGIRCTAWLASKDIVITTRRCIATAEDAAGARVAFNFEDGNGSEPLAWYNCSQFVKSWDYLDMTALRCAPRDGLLPGQVQGYLLVSSENAQRGTPIYVLHQGCDSYLNPGCALTKKSSPGIILRANYRIAEVSYDADTVDSSLGAPVLAASSHEVVALHHLGFNADAWGRGTHNVGIRSSHIAAALRELDIGCPVYAGEQCYWMGFHDTGTWSAWCWQPATWAPDFQTCYAMDSCDGGLGQSGGGCYKWATSSEAPRQPW